MRILLIENPSVGFVASDFAGLHPPLAAAFKIQSGEPNLRVDVIK